MKGWKGKIQIQRNYIKFFFNKYFLFLFQEYFAKSYFILFFCHKTNIKFNPRITIRIGFQIGGLQVTPLQELPRPELMVQLCFLVLYKYFRTQLVLFMVLLQTSFHV